MVENRFGGSWTEAKLICLRAYLHAYSNALKNQKFDKIYIDPFCGSGSWGSEELLTEDLLDPADRVINPGSPLTALEVGTYFDAFYFNDQNPDFISSLKENVKGLSSDKTIYFSEKEANQFIFDLIEKFHKANLRGVMFLDPFGLQIDWLTLQAIAKTEAIDIVMLFPSSGLTRMLPSTGLPNQAWQQKLNQFLGTMDWKDFYHVESARDLFGEILRTERRAKMPDIMKFVVKRLQEHFYVVDKTLELKNSRGSNLFHLIFLCANRSEKAHKLFDKLARWAIDYAQEEFGDGRRK